MEISPSRRSDLTASKPLSGLGEAPAPPLRDVSRVVRRPLGLIGGGETLS